MRPIELILLSLSIVLTLKAYFSYYMEARESRIAPNRWSWLIWTFTTGVEVFTFYIVSADIETTAVFSGSFIASAVITGSVWSRGKWMWPSLSELACVIASFAALAIVFLFHAAWWAHVIAVAAIPISFLPTYRSAQADYRRELTSSWLFWTIGDLLALAYVAIRMKSAEELPYAAVEAMCHAGVWLIVRSRQGKATEAMPVVISGPSQQNHYASIRVGENHLGKAVFAIQAIEAGSTIMPFRGEPILATQLPRVYCGPTDRYMQIAHDLYLGPSGCADDYVNHSCEPNTGVRFTDNGLFLEALRFIRPGEEIVWDYSTTMHGSNWFMRCECRAPSCRRYVGDFSSIPTSQAAYYLRTGIVAPFIVEWITQKEDEFARAPRVDTTPRNLTIRDLLAKLNEFASEQKEETSSLALTAQDNVLASLGPLSKQVDWRSRGACAATYLSADLDRARSVIS